MTAEKDRPEFSRVIALEEIGERGTAVNLVANEGERSALARRFGLKALGRLTASLRLDPVTEHAGAIRLSGTFDAEVTQTCVVTLEPVTQAIHEPLTLVFAPAPVDAPVSEVEVLMDDDPPEPLPEEGIDAGEVIAEHLALAINPYPRHPDAPSDPLAYETEDSAGESPFAALGQLKRKL